MPCDQDARDATRDAAVPLLRVNRSGVKDNLHRGVAVAVDDAGKVLLSFGDPAMRAYIRSAAKPIQALPVILSGAADAYGFDDADLAIVCGSHKGGESQIAQVRSVLAKAGLAEGQLKSGGGIADNCSGKHAGMLAASKHSGLDLDSYLDPDHPHQRSILETLGRVCGLEVSAITLGTDGCGAPIHYIPVVNMALAYARMSRPGGHFDEAMCGALERITLAMQAHPGGHTGEPDYAGALGEARFLTKGGGNGIYCALVPGRGIGFAMKVEDGASAPLKPVFTEVMRRLGIITDEEAALFRERFWPKIVNRRGATVGDVELLLPAPG
ncbi:MAG: asparaginase [Planctomycetota bacterium]